MDDEDDRTRAAVNPQPPFVPSGPTFWRRGFLWGLLSGWILVGLPWAVLMFVTTRNTGDGQLPHMNGGLIYNESIILLLPVIQGFVGGLMRGPNKHGFWSGVGLTSMLWAADTTVVMIFLREGVICLILAAPIFIGIMGIAYAAGRGIACFRKAKTLSVSLLPLALLATIGETLGPKPDQAEVVTDSITVNAPANYVWKYVVDYPDNPNPPAYWLWQIGLPAPTHSVAPVQKVGAHRECRFSGGQVFEERIVRLEPNKNLTFAITQQPTDPEIIGHLTVDQGQIALRQNADGTTTMIATSWYRLHVRPAGYFGWWAADITRHVHFRVLGYMKTLAERDYRAGSGT